MSLLAVRRLLVVVCCAALAACATTRPALPPAQWEQRSSELQHLNTWQFDGRAAVALSQAGGSPGPVDAATPGAATPGGASTQGWQANMSWREKSARAEVHLSGPFGVGALVLAQTAQGVSLNGSPPSDVVMAQVEARLGFVPPLDQLRFWLLGVPDPSAEFRLTRNDSDRARQLLQAGWSIDYDRYMPVNGDALPAHLVLSREGVRVRIVVDHWSGLK